jgi:hypothetical protein
MTQSGSEPFKTDRHGFRGKIVWHGRVHSFARTHHTPDKPKSTL